MKSLFERRLWTARALSLCAGFVLWIGLSGGAAAGVPVAQRWDEGTWAQRLAHGPRPAAYLFTTSYCSTCPDAFTGLRQAVQQRHRSVALVPVIMDLEGPKAQRHAAYFEGLTELFVFDGFEPAIRQSIDPDWQDITPYIVLIDRQGRLQRSIGPPDGKALLRWLR